MKNFNSIKTIKIILVLFTLWGIDFSIECYVANTNSKIQLKKLENWSQSIFPKENENKAQNINILIFGTSTSTCYFDEKGVLIFDQSYADMLRRDLGEINTNYNVYNFSHYSIENNYIMMNFFKYVISRFKKIDYIIFENFRYLTIDEWLDYFNLINNFFKNITLKEKKEFFLDLNRDVTLNPGNCFRKFRKILLTESTAFKADKIKLDTLEQLVDCAVSTGEIDQLMTFLSSSDLYHQNFKYFNTAFEKNLIGYNNFSDKYVYEKNKVLENLKLNIFLNKIVSSVNNSKTKIFLIPTLFQKSNEFKVSKLHDYRNNINIIFPIEEINLVKKERNLKNEQLFPDGYHYAGWIHHILSSKLLQAITQE